MNNMGTMCEDSGGAGASVRTKGFLSTPFTAVRTFLISVEELMTEDGGQAGGGGGEAHLSTVSTAVPSPKHFHLHLVSDASGETLTTMAKAAIVQLSGAKPNRHMHPLIRNPRQLATVLRQIEAAPGHRALHPYESEPLRDPGKPLRRSRPALRRGAEARH